MKQTVSRREMLAALMALTAGVTVATGGVPRRLDAFVGRGALFATEPELDAWVTAQLGQADVTSIATAWRQSHPAESSAAAVTRAIVARRRGREPLGEYLARAVAEEHRDGRAEAVDGWYLAPTEARLATLLDLVREAAR
jgi:hypothetical protein